MFFSDIHMHLLYGVDDGAKTKDEMLKMLDMAYKRGTRLICATPHFKPREFGDNCEITEKVFSELCQYANEKYPDLELWLGNELFCSKDCENWLRSGRCKTMGGTRYVLVEFKFEASEAEIEKSLRSVLNFGYIPIIAHAERYKNLTLKKLQALSSMGVLVQANADMIFEGFFHGMRLRRMLSKRLVDFISTDAHDNGKRPPLMKSAFEIISKKYSKNYAETICYKNAYSLFSSKRKENEES